jgi:hypothetical protein
MTAMVSGGCHGNQIKQNVLTEAFQETSGRELASQKNVP